MCNWRLTAVECALNIRGNHGRPINSKTVRNLLRELGIRALHPYIGHTLLLLDVSIAAHAPRRFALRQCRQVFFRDKSRFSLYRSDGRQHVY